MNRVKRKALVVVLLLGVGLTGTFACGGSSPAQPTPTPVPTPEPPPVNPPPANTPPRIVSITPSADRAEIETEVELTAHVEDADTGLDKLTYEWTAAKGTISGSGLTVRWRAPKEDETPVKYSITLTVTEKFEVEGPEGPQPQEFKVTASSPDIFVNNTPKEIRDIAGGFLKRFSNSSVSPEACVESFSDNCRGKRDELRDITQNRALYVIESAMWSISSVTVNPERTFADITAPCEFNSMVKATGALQLTKGTCLLTSVYEDHRWWLCDSHYRPSSGSLLGLGVPF